MKAHLFRGSKQEIAERLIRITGEVREAIILEEEPADIAREAGPSDVERLFAEMTPFMVTSPEADDCRAAIYTRLAGE